MKCSHRNEVIIKAVDRLVEVLLLLGICHHLDMCRHSFMVNRLLNGMDLRLDKNIEWIMNEEKGTKESDLDRTTGVKVEIVLEVENARVVINLAIVQKEMLREIDHVMIGPGIDVKIVVNDQGLPDQNAIVHGIETVAEIMSVIENVLEDNIF